MALVVGSTVLTIAAIEGVARLVVPGITPRLPMYEKIEGPGYAPIPGYRGSGPLGESIVVDTRGLRHRTGSPSPISDRPLRILALGDSFQFGLGVPAEQTLSAHLERALASRGTPAVVWNAGVPGYNLFQSVRALERWLPALEPDVVVLGVLENDLHNVDGPDLVARDDGTLTRRPGAFDPAAQVNPFAALGGVWLDLQLRSAAFRWLSFRLIQRQLAIEGDQQLSALAEGALASDVLADRLLRGELDAETTPRFEGAAALLARAAERSAAAGAELVVLFFPRPEQLVAPGLRGGTARLESAAKRLGLRTVDPAQRLAGEASRVGLYLFPDDHHPGGRAYEIMAEELSEAIAAATGEDVSPGTNPQ